MDFQFDRHRIDKISRERALLALEAAAKLCDYLEFGKREFNDVNVGISASGVRNAFGSWASGMAALRAYLRERGIELKTKNHVIIPDQLLFSELERIWSQLRHRPSRYEWESSSPKFSYSTYKYRFGGWQQACLQFIEYRMGSAVEITPLYDETDLATHKITSNSKSGQARVRNPSDSLRLRLLDRDGYRCVLCGRTPAEDRRVRLHIDHIVPFAKNGETIFENLQTLCAECNLGKSDSETLGAVRA